MSSGNQTGANSTVKRMEFEFHGKSYKFTINPDTYSQKEPNRVNVTQTKGGAFVEAFGAGLPEITISGTTGFKVGTENPETGFEKFKELKELIKSVYSSVQDGSEITESLFFYNYTDEEYWATYPDSFELTRSKSQPLLYHYSIHLICLGKIGEWSPDTGEENAGVGNPNGVTMTHTSTMEDTDSGTTTNKEDESETNSNKDAVKTQTPTVEPTEKKESKSLLEKFKDGVKDIKNSKFVKEVQDIYGTYKAVKNEVNKVKNSELGKLFNKSNSSSSSAGKYMYNAPSVSMNVGIQNSSSLGTSNSMEESSKVQEVLKNYAKILADNFAPLVGCKFGNEGWCPTVAYGVTTQLSVTNMGCTNVGDASCKEGYKAYSFSSSLTGLDLEIFAKANAMDTNIVDATYVTGTESSLQDRMIAFARKSTITDSTIYTAIQNNSCVRYTELYNEILLTLLMSFSVRYCLMKYTQDYELNNTILSSDTLTKISNNIDYIKYKLRTLKETTETYSVSYIIAQLSVLQQNILQTKSSIMMYLK